MTWSRPTTTVVVGLTSESLIRSLNSGHTPLRCAQTRVRLFIEISRRNNIGRRKYLRLLYAFGVSVRALPNRWLCGWDYNIIIYKSAAILRRGWSSRKRKKIEIYRSHIYNATLAAKNACAPPYLGRIYLYYCPKEVAREKKIK